MKSQIYEALGYPRSNRISYFNRLKTETCNKNYPLRYGGENLLLPVFEIPLSRPIYRMDNIRTLNAHKEYLENHPELKKDFFLDVDDVNVQKVQEGLLSLMAKEANLYNAFAKGLLPNVPLILSDDGVVIDGNRRLCVYRTLYSSNPQKYKYLKTVKVALLPDHNPSLLHELEQELQMANSLKAKYHWYDEAYSYILDYESNGISYEETASRLRIQNSSLIPNLVECYRYGEKYLNLIGRKNQWSLLDHQETVLLHLVKGRKKLDSIPEKAIYERLVFALMFMDGEKENGSIVKNVDYLFKNKQIITEELCRFFSIQAKNESLLLAKSLNEMILDKLGILILSILQEIKDAENGKENHYHLRTQLKKADKILSDLITSQYGEQNTDHLNELLDNMEESIRAIRSLFSK